jgi:alpha-ketoglutarate-dependent taurine dioxygenase
MRKDANDPIVCPSADELYRRADAVSAALRAYGYCVLEAWDANYETLRLVAELCGAVQSHIRADAEGIVGERPARHPEWREHAEEYQGTTSEEFLPHTDGTFLDGAVLAGETLLRLGPPKLVLLQCVRAARSGGVNLLVDGQRIFDDLVMSRRDLLAVLLRAGCAAFCRDDQSAFGSAVYARAGENRVRQRFRFDGKTYAPAWARWALRTLHYEYHMDPRRMVEVQLRSAQILLVDNYRVLHGRTAFGRSGDSHERQLRRAWIYDGEAERLESIEGAPSGHRALARYEPYRPVRDPAQPESLVRFEAGIALTERTRGALDALFAERPLARAAPA